MHIHENKARRSTEKHTRQCSEGRLDSDTLDRRACAQAEQDLLKEKESTDEELKKVERKCSTCLYL